MTARMAMNELMQMAQLKEPLWMAGLNNSAEILNEEEYLRLFGQGFGPRTIDYRTEASRETAVVFMNPEELVKIFMDEEKWTKIFASIVSRAVTQQVIFTGADGSHDGACQVMQAEFRVPAPLGPKRKFLFVRYCKKYKDGMWMVVDVSLNRAFYQVELCRRRPSGCLIEAMPNSYSKVTWVEHVEAEVDDIEVPVVPLFTPLLKSGIAFGAKRWVNTLERQCERLASIMEGNNIPNGVITNPEGKRQLFKLADRMVENFFSNLTVSRTDPWTTMYNFWGGDVHVMMRSHNEGFAGPFGTTLNATTTVRLPVLPNKVFDYLCDKTTRSKWDMLSHGVIQEKACIAISGDHRNCLSLLNPNSTIQEPSHLILQETCTEPTASYIIYQSVYVPRLDAILNGQYNNVPLEPSGFVILPDNPQFQSEALYPIDEAMSNEVHGHLGEDEMNGSLVIMSFQIPMPVEELEYLPCASIKSVNQFFGHIVEAIKAAFPDENGAQ